jgi:predicted transposase/invertase (TIGR01784 family)
MGKFDKIIKETLKKGLPEIVPLLTGIEFEKMQILEVKLQQTIEREADFLLLITDKQQKTKIVQIEFQSQNDHTMPDRMLHYKALILNEYHLPSTQFVIYLGNKPLQMANEIIEEDLSYRYHLIDIRNLPYETFIQSKAVGSLLLAILTNLGKKTPNTVIQEVIEKLKQNHKGLTLSKTLIQLKILSELRNFQALTKQLTKNMGVIIDEKTTSIYQEGKIEGKMEGKMEGKIEGKTEDVKEMLNLGLQIELIQQITKLSKAEILQIKKSMGL